MSAICLPDLQAEYPDQCGFMWSCGARFYASQIETLAYLLAGAQFDVTCPECGFGTVYDFSPATIRLDLRTPVAREIALDMTGNLDAPL